MRKLRLYRRLVHRNCRRRHSASPRSPAAACTASGAARAAERRSLRWSSASARASAASSARPPPPPPPMPPPRAAPRRVRPRGSRYTPRQRRQRPAPAARLRRGARLLRRRLRRLELGLRLCRRRARGRRTPRRRHFSRSAASSPRAPNCRRRGARAQVPLGGLSSDASSPHSSCSITLSACGGARLKPPARPPPCVVAERWPAAQSIFFPARRLGAALRRAAAGLEEPALNGHRQPQVAPFHTATDAPLAGCCPSFITLGDARCATPTRSALRRTYLMPMALSSVCNTSSCHCAVLLAGAWRVGVRQNSLACRSGAEIHYREPTPCRHVLL